VGELCIAGPQVGKGYWHREELTAEKFVDCPYRPGEKMYRTGDLVRWNEEGQLEYIGRIDNQIKLRGFRIELGEIESAATKIEGISQAVAMVRRDTLCLYYTGEIDCAGITMETAPSSSESLLSSTFIKSEESILKSILSQTLTEYMVPTVYIKLESMPLTSNGKIDRRALPEPEFSTAEYIAPTNDTERLLAETMKELLGLETEVSIDEEFYSLGGDSIKAMRLSSLIRKAGYIVSVSQIMQLQTVRNLAETAQVINEEENTLDLQSSQMPMEEYFASQEEFEAVRAEFERRGESIEDVYPLTPMQEGMLLKHLSESESWGYRLVNRYKLNVIPTEEQMRRAVDALARQHETLRTSIIYQNVETPVQAIIDRKIEVGFEKKSTEEEIEVIHRRELDRGFDLQYDSLMRVVCIPTGKNKSQILIAMHHIITDGWSLPIYLGHLFENLQRATEGEEIEVTTDDNGKYGRYARGLKAKDKDAGLNYWKNLLEGYETKAEITPYGRTEETEDNQVFTELSQESTEKLQQAAASNSASIANVAEMAWGIVLQRCCRQDDVVFAKVVSGRNNASEDVDTVVGPFINSVPVRIKAEDNDTIRTLIRKVAEQSAESTRWDWCGLSDIQSQTQLGSNLFQCIFAYENYPARKRNEEESTLKIKTVKSKEESFNELAVSAYVQNDRLCLHLTYDRAKFSRKYIERLTDAYKNVLEQIAGNNNSKIQDISLINEQEEKQLIELGTGERLDYDKTKTFVDIFTEQAIKTPDNIAVVDKESRITYKELDDESNAIAHWLIDEYNIHPNDFVAVMLPRRKEFVTSVIGIMKAGAAYVPIDPEYPEERKRFMINDCEAKVVITQEMLEGFRKRSSTAYFATSVNLAVPEGLAYMIYTSGSTGEPKGAMLAHRGLTNFIHVVRKMEQLTEIDRISGHRSFSFDAHIQDLFPILTVGGSFHIMPEDIRTDIHAIKEFLDVHKITGGGYATTVATMLLQTYSDLPVRFITAGGEKLKRVYSDRVRIINGYGTTECTDDASFFVIKPGESRNDIPIGRPVENTFNCIVDEVGRLLPRGMVGELCIAGPQVAKGYWHRPELTAEKFVDCLYRPGEKIYKTGDLVRWNEDGQLEYIGRIDNQIKLRGFRIELGEIESAATKIEGINQAVAMVRRDTLCLYYTGEINKDYIASEATISLSEDTSLSPALLHSSTFVSSDESILKSILSQTLTEYMVPTVYIKLESMPLIPNGKIDRKSLPEPEIHLTESVPPNSFEEKALCSVLKEELGISNIGVTDNLRQLGLTSIKCMMILSRVQKSYFSTMKFGYISKAETVRDIIRLRNEDNCECGSWLNGFDESKPVIVLCCGVISENSIVGHIRDWIERYNIYVLQPVFNSWPDYIEVSQDEMLRRYELQLEKDIPKIGHVNTFIGFSFGGELAYHLAYRWNDKYGCAPAVLMGDTRIELKEDADFIKQLDDINEKIIYTFQKEYFRGLIRLSIPEYNGKVVLFSAVQEEGALENEDKWRDTLHTINIIQVEDTHNGLYHNDINYPKYLQSINELN